MTEIVKFVLGGFWHFVGAMVLIGAIGEAGAQIIGACRRATPPSREP